MWNILENEIYVRIHAEQLLILQLRIALFECLGSKFDMFGAVPAVFRMAACNSLTIHSVSTASAAGIKANSPVVNRHAKRLLPDRPLYATDKLLVAAA